MAEFHFQCPTCGEYPVSQETFFFWFPPDRLNLLEEKLGLGVLGATMKFKSECPKCQPKGGISNARVEFIWPPGKRPEEEKTIVH